MHTRSLMSITALLLGILVAPTAESAAQGRTVTVTRANGRTASATTTVDRDGSDGTVGAQRTVTGFNGRTATSSRGTAVGNGSVQRQFSRTGFGGRTASRQDVYTEHGGSHTRTTRNGTTRAWSRQR